jgi:hypothetical protein
MPTMRIIERRRSSERRKPRQIELEAPVEAPVAPWPATTQGWNRVAVVSVATFAFGVLLTITVNRLTRHTRTEAIAQVEHASLPMTATAPVPVEQAPVAPVVQPLAKPEPAPVPEPMPAPTAAQAKAKLPRAATAPAVLRPRRAATTPPPTMRTADPGAAEKPAAKPTGPRKWVDPFAE